MSGTISDEEWAELQRRAREANPQLADTFGDEATRRRLEANQQAKAGREGRN